MTHAYQLSSRAEIQEAAEHFSRMVARPLSPEQLFDSFAVLAPLRRCCAAIRLPPQNSERPAQRFRRKPARTDFIRRMRPPPGDPTEYREGTLQALLLMNGKTMSDVTASGQNSILGGINAPFMTDDDCVQSLFLAAYARQPSDDEAKACLAAS